MKKYTIPSVLVAIVLIAGIFAFMPINEATTVHTTIQNTQLQIKTTTDTFQTLDADANEAIAVPIDPSAPFILLAMTIECTPGDDATNTVDCDAAQDMDFTSYAADGATAVTTLATTDLLGTDTDDDAARVLNIYGITAESGANANGFRTNISVADRLIVNLTLDTLSDGVDDDYILTTRVTILTAGTTAFTANEITITS